MYLSRAYAQKNQILNWIRLAQAESIDSMQTFSTELSCHSTSAHTGEPSLPQQNYGLHVC
jgi:hypothetical protein